MENSAQINPRDRQFLGHPIGLWVLFTTEMWERFCYYGMRALLVLYLTSALTAANPGFGWTEKGAYHLYGWFTGLVYFFPLFGGLIADRFIGPHRSVVFGGVLMALGELALWGTELFRAHAESAISFASSPSTFVVFIAGLALITVGNGFFKPCISVMVSQLYGPEDKRRDAAFTYFYMGINVGAFLAPFVAGTVAEKFGWHWGFGVASLGMIFGLCTYSFLRPKYLGHIGMVQRETALAGESAVSGSAPKSPLTRKEVDRIGVILILSVFSIAFWSVFEQAGSSLTTFAKKETNRVVPGNIADDLSGVFLPNEDENDAAAAIEDTKRNMLEVSRTLDLVNRQVEETRIELLEERRADGDFAAAAAEFTDSVHNAADSIQAASSALEKANVARSKIGFEPLDLAVPSMDELLAEARADRERVRRRAEEEGRSENDILREEAAAKDEARMKNLDPAKTVWTFPSTWYQSVNPLVVVILGPIFAGLWLFLGKRNLEPSTPVKFGIGLIVLSMAFLFMVGGAVHSSETAGNAAAHWLLITYVLCTVGELCLSPVGLSMVTRLSPPRYASFLMGLWFLSSAVAGYLSGTLASFLGAGDSLAFCFKKGMADYFLILAAVPFAAGIIMFLIAPLLRRMMHED
ncbi:MAG: peptide MFS transporter [Thermoguttaceae bacterium]|nr:peptide MFS transporter [Thermoguttaceae bacterium]